MKYLLDNLFFFGQIASLAALLWGAALVMGEYLIETVCPGRKTGGQIVSMTRCVLHPFLRMARA